MYIVVFNIENIRIHLGGGCDIEWIFYFKDTKVNIDSYSEYVAQDTVTKESVMGNKYR